MKYDFAENPRAWSFTGELRKVYVPDGWWGRKKIAYQWVFEKEGADDDGYAYTVRIGVMIVDGRVSIQDPPAGG